MIGRADIKGSKSNFAMNTWLRQASYTCGNFSDTSSFKFRRTKGSIGHTFTVHIDIGNHNQTSFYPFVPHEISLLVELILGHLSYLLTDVSPQPNSSQSFSRGYGSILLTSLAYIVPSTRGYSPWRPDAVISTTEYGRHSALQILRGHRGCTGHHVTCGALPAARPYLWLSRFQGG
uniref:Uncharacterized protein YLR162W-A family n=1 Tax=Cajanus cajan TaxID=3821 RepID=A0A151UG01_CAJCA